MASDAPQKFEPSLAILDLFPAQGQWRDGDYFSLPGNRLVELVGGSVEVLPMPSLLHQFLAQLLFVKFYEHVTTHGLGIVMSAPTRVRIAEGHYREPDILFVSKENAHRHQEQYWEKIDLALEIISPDEPNRDWIDKRRDYAQAGIQEYWIVDPRDDSISVGLLEGNAYLFADSELAKSKAESSLLTSFSVDVVQLFQQARSM